MWLQYLHNITTEFTLWGPVHKDIFESATFSFGIRLLSTHIRWIRKFLNPLFRVENNYKMYTSNRNDDPAGLRWITTYKVFFDAVLLRIKICSCYVSSDLSNFQDLRPRFTATYNKSFTCQNSKTLPSRIVCADLNIYERRINSESNPESRQKKCYRILAYL